MVRNNKTKADVTTDLADFLPSEQSSFVDWLWRFISSYFEMKSSVAASSPSTSAATTTTTVTEAGRKPTNKLLFNAVKQATDDTKNILLSPSTTTTTDLESGSGGHHHNKKKHHNNRDRNNNGHSTSNTDVTNMKITIRNDTSSPSRKRKINNSRDHSTSEGDENIDEENQENDEDEEMRVSNDRVTKRVDKKEKCSFWPLCKKNDCPFYHPTIQCNLFPKCPYGDKCLYIHPSIPCKFGFSCTNPVCSFNHPQRPMGAAGFDNAIPCKYGFSCPNKSKFCSFSHPPVACKFGESCTNGKRCIFGHGKPCMFGSSCVTPGCTFAHYIGEAPAIVYPECKFGEACTNPHCKFQHADRINTDSLSNTLPSTPPQEMNSEESSNATSSVTQAPIDLDVTM